jgi:hypothetical protein
MSPYLDPGGLNVVYETILRCQQARKEGVYELKDIFSPEPRLVVTPNDNCSGGCLHCIADSKSIGTTIDYEAFTEINPKFFEIFSVADFGRRGNPLEYKSKGNDLADMIQFLYDKGIPKFTIAVAIQKDEAPIIERLENLADNGIPIDTLLTYHHYHANLDKERLANEINLSIKNFSKFSKKITVALLGDDYNHGGFIMAKDVKETFERNNPVIYEGIEISPSEDEYHEAECDGKYFQIRVTPVNTMVYPWGRFKDYLSRKGIIKDYEKFFYDKISDYVCPDLIKWPGIIIEPDGSLNMCGSFEAITCDKSRFSNILSNSFETLEEELLQFHEKELDWFVKNLDQIIQGSVSCCKIKNNCYE